MKVESEALGLRLNVTETKLIKVGSYVSNQPLLVDGTEVECVDPEVPAIQKARYSEGPLLRKLAIQKARYSEF